MPTIWYKEKRGKDGRRKVYRKLRELGLHPELARWLRDWSDGHINLFLKSNFNLEWPFQEEQGGDA